MYHMLSSFVRYHLNPLEKEFRVFQARREENHRRIQDYRVQL